jgi:hypothetical protein
MPILLTHNTPVVVSLISADSCLLLGGGKDLRTELALRSCARADRLKAGDFSITPLEYTEGTSLEPPMSGNRRQKQRILGYYLIGQLFSHLSCRFQYVIHPITTTDPMHPN